MQYQKLTITLVFMMLTLSSIIAGNKQVPFSQLNETMQVELELTDAEMHTIKLLNRKYWYSRKNILHDQERIGQNTALLVRWDTWRVALAKHLTDEQMEKFMRWQATVDLLSEAPI